MSQQVITPELCEWIADQSRVGHASESILAAMLGSGWDEAVARQALARTLGQSATLTAPPGTTPGLPEPDLSRFTPVIDAGDRQVKVVMALRQPRVVVFGELLSEEECDGIIALATQRLARSETVATGAEGSEVNAARTSDGMFFERGEAELIQRVEARIAALLRWPLDHGEGLQVLRYRPGAEYQPHYDYFDPGHVSTPGILRRGGQRVGTLVVYLNTPVAGGSTIFPDIGLDVAPVKGNAVFFSYDRPHPATQTLHGGSPVVEGEKWVATKWLRQGVFT
ncbi:2OG-Fe(II) oxygenase [Roseateles saccharophilus]|uniref:Prolyl 4-hydroxylase n=1 Tax=Roseateles saccharophilus TaxID=304 RepID=A0A4R3VDJ0_ROSSA|nr:2OG-Fe(II) oxygenase [Roseateles saccharophilus]MDG0835965.1 2-oxoglutarate-dependent dioxygenase [Roseateles saccharophilus]TCV03396.1 prolyl 4-hydroxylase [Roseateles saccharophilus]